MSLQRQFDRQRRIRNGDDHPKALDALNEKLYHEGRILHATKGFRPVSERRSRVQMFMAEQKKGLIPPFHWNLQGVIDMSKKFIQTGLWA